MRKICLVLSIIFSFSYSSQGQTNDTLSAKVIWIKNFQECSLIGAVSSCNAIDTSVLISTKNINTNLRKERKIQVGQTYTFFVEKDIVIASPTRRMSVKFKNTIVWTNEEPYKLKPRLCLNCIGEYMK
ncbi:hypothetical protein CLV59_103421 [Chitinophaga dinghuensis]|uniref:Uncharacterized protein n=1 Tax=Chitinophaga dinghuensis TaxID=1539050 RepID=A0A327W462_9BACT|nr:hypothetical protein CLV59_103421 [Chitinophaga dinghuensis]